MIILDIQDKCIRNFLHFKNYNREKSYIIFEGGVFDKNYAEGVFFAHIFRKGDFKFEIEKNFKHCKVSRL